MFAAQLTAAQQTAFRAAAGRGPRVYNALITSEQRLLPSQAEPILTPAFRTAFPFFYGGWPYAFEPLPFSFPAAGVDTEAAAAEVQQDVVAAVRDDDDDDDAASRRPAPAPPAVKNNRPAGSSVPDVPPPPLPVSGRGDKDKKKPEEYPPAPVGFAI